MNWNPNELFYDMWKIREKFKRDDNKIQIYNQGGTRSSKTWDTIHFLIYLCDQYREEGLRIYVLRDTLAKCKEKTIIEFEKCFKIIDIPFQIRSPNHKPYLNLWGNHIYFRGLPAGS